MAYDKELDEELYGEDAEIGDHRIRVSVYSYSGATPKLQISRQTLNQSGEYSYKKLGRMTKEEIEAIMPLINKALESM